MNELTVQELLDYLSNVVDKTKVVRSVDDNGNESSLFIDSTNKTTILLGQFYED